MKPHSSHGQAIKKQISCVCLQGAAKHLSAWWPSKQVLLFRLLARSWQRMGTAAPGTWGGWILAGPRGISTRYRGTGCFQLALQHEEDAMPAVTTTPLRETYSATCGQFSEHLHLQPLLCPVPQAACTAPGLTRGRGHCCVSPVTQRGAQSSSDQSWLASLPPPSGSLHPSVPIFLLGHLLDQGCCTKPG